MWTPGGADIIRAGSNGRRRTQSEMPVALLASGAHIVRPANFGLKEFYQYIGGQGVTGTRELLITENKSVREWARLPINGLLSFLSLPLALGQAFKKHLYYFNLASHTVYHSRDRGQSWEAADVTTGTIYYPEPVSGSRVSKRSAVRLNQFSTTIQTIQRTTDGETWTDVYVLGGDTVASDGKGLLYCGQEVYISRYDSVDPEVLLARSDDGGLTWETIEVNPTGTWIDRADVNQAEGHLLSGIQNAPFHSLDRGATWSTAGGWTSNIGCVSCQNPDAWIAWGNSVGSTHLYLLSVDQGASWIELNASLYGLVRVDYLFTTADGDFIVANTSGEIWKSYDGGVSWVLIFTAGANIILCPSVDGQNFIAYLASRNSTIFISSDQGDTWEAVTITECVHGFEVIRPILLTD